MAAHSRAGAVSLPFHTKKLYLQQLNGLNIGNVYKSNLLHFNMTVWINIYILTLIATTVLPCFANTLNQKQCTGNENTYSKHLAMPLFDGYTGTRFSDGQFASYCNVLNNGKTIIPKAALKKKTTRHKSPKLLWKLSGYLILMLLLAGDVHLNSDRLQEKRARSTSSTDTRGERMSWLG